ncbi:MAG: NAD(P)-dependent malic enzyme [Candidatus Nanoarchaeia archaeon]
MDYYKESLKLHKKHKGKIQVNSKVPLENQQDLSLAYTPGVAEACKRIEENPEEQYKYTVKGNMVGVVTDGSAVLGLGNIGAKASLPVMEGKCVLFKKFAKIDAFPIAIDTQDTEEFIQSVKNIAPGFGGINLEDISAPRCFEIEKRLKNDLEIPVFHDDQHGTAIVVLAGLINALKLTQRNEQSLRVVVNGAGAAGIAIVRLLLSYGVEDITVLDSKGAIYKGRDGLNPIKNEIAEFTNFELKEGNLDEITKNKDVFIGVSKGEILTSSHIKSMARDPIIFALANPVPEIWPDEAKKAGVGVIATGRSDYPNQVNNVLAFPGIFRGALDARVRDITEKMKLKAAEALADSVRNPKPDKVIPGPFKKGVSKRVAEAVRSLAE